MLLPSQDPPQALPSDVHEVRDPCGVPLTATQVPWLPETSQAWHWPPHELLQQKPSTQFPLPHWFAAVHAPPLASFGTQEPALQ